MPAQTFDWQAIQQRENGLIVNLTVYDQAILLDALLLMRDRYRWPVDDATYDDIEAAVSKAQEAVMTNALIGTIVFRGGPPADNELVCDGAQYARVDYPILYEKLAAVFIVDADNFTVPKLTNRFVTGVDEIGIGNQGGAPTVTLTEANLPPHTHLYTPPVLNVDIEGAGVPDVFAAGVGLPTQTGSTGSATPFSILPPYSGVLPCLIAR